MRRDHRSDRGCVAGRFDHDHVLLRKLLCESLETRPAHAGLYWLQAALNQPLKPGSRVLVVSSGAAENGSPMSGGYGGAKRMLWFMAKYANGISEKKRLGIRFQAIVPQQMVLGTGVGDAGANAYAHAMGMKPEKFVARFGAPMPPREFGDKVVSVLDDPKYAEGFAFGVKGDTGVTMLEAAAA
jgi:hypothetical protein